MHISDDQIRTYLDDELSAEARALAAAHFEHCPRCLDSLDRLRSESEWVRTQLSDLNPQEAVSASTARSRLQARIGASPKESPPMMKPNLRRILAPALGVLVLLLFFVPGVRAAAVEFLGLFRVEQVQAIPFNPANLPENLEERMMDFDGLLQEQFAFSESGAPEEVADAAAAAALAGFDVRLPEGDSPARLTVQPGGEAVMTIDLALWQALLDEFAGGGPDLPASLEGKAVTVALSSSVTYLSGECAHEDAAPNRAHQLDCTALVQMPSPTVDAPPEMPVAELGEVFLQFLGLSAEDAARLSSTIDWTTTLVVPVPTGSGYDEVDVNGAEGLLFSTRYESGTSNHSLIWVEDGILYALMVNGRQSADQVLALAEGLQ